MKKEPKKLMVWKWDWVETWRGFKFQLVTNRWAQNWVLGDTFFLLSIWTGARLIHAISTAHTTSHLAPPISLPPTHHSLAYLLVQHGDHFRVLALGTWQTLCRSQCPCWVFACLFARERVELLIEHSVKWFKNSPWRHCPSCWHTFPVQLQGQQQGEWQRA